MVYTVVYMNPQGNNEDEYISLVLDGKDEQDVMDIAMRDHQFRSHINMEYFDSSRMKVLRPRNMRINTFFHYKALNKEELKQMDYGTDDN